MRHRGERVAERIRAVLADTLRDEVRDRRVGFVTLTEVELSPDLRQARVFVSRLGSDADRDDAVEALNHAAPFLRRALARRAGLRYTPELRFVSDATLARGSRVEELIQELRGDPEPGGRAPDDGE